MSIRDRRKLSDETKSRLPNSKKRSDRESESVSLISEEMIGIPAALADNPGFLLNRAARIVREMNNQSLKPTGLSVRDLGMLRVIKEEGPLSQQALGERHKTDRTTVVAVIDALEQRQLVVRLPNEKDRRSHLLTMTPRGNKLLAAAVKMVDSEKKRFLQPLDENEWQQLRQSLCRLIEFHQRQK